MGDRRESFVDRINDESKTFQGIYAKDGLNVFIPERHYRHGATPVDMNASFCDVPGDDTSVDEFEALSVSGPNPHLMKD